MSSDDEYILCGTPIVDADEVEIAIKRPTRDLEVRDDKGRQRFHGAFTGGFSAGHFNTVGTKEGWAPSSFLSSRNKKNDRIQQQPEDFMDSEDLGEFGIAPRKIQTTSRFQDSLPDASRKRTFKSFSDASIPGEPPLKELIKPVLESIGVIILKKMGWKPGQGIGPRIRKKTKKQMKTTEKIYGCDLPPSSASSEEDDPISESFMFAPDDTPVHPYLPKDDYHGIGYSGLSTVSVLSVPLNAFEPSSTKTWLSKEKKKLSISGQAFGVGALEEDDDDIYATEDMSQYDFSDWAEKKSKPNEKKKVTSIGHKDNYSVKTLDGFCVASKPLAGKKHYPPPELPNDFKPLHKSLLSTSKLQKNVHLQRHKLTADERSVMLGERKFTCSETIPTEQLEKKVAETTVKSLETSSREFSQPLPAASSKFMPFSKDKQKQKRYEEYLRLRASGDKDALKYFQPVSMTEWEKQRELQEFAQAATLYQPMSQILTSRFESGKHLEVEPVIPTEVNIKEKTKSDKEAAAEKKMFGPLTREKLQWHPASLLCRRFNVPNPYPDSTSVGLHTSKHNKTSIFGFLTTVDNHTKQKDKENENLSVNPNYMSMMKTSDDSKTVLEKNIIIKEKEEHTSKGTDIETSNTKAEKEEDKDDTRPPMDLFKAIFQNTSSDDSSSSDREESTDAVKDESTPTITLLSLSPKVSTKQKIMGNTEEFQNSTAVTQPEKFGTKQAFGVFANLDLDALNKRSSLSSKASTSTDAQKTEILDKSNNANFPNDYISMNKKYNADTLKTDTTSLMGSKEEFYGPKLPPSGSIASSFQIVEKKSVSSKHLKHKKEKHKHKHHKHKKKSKKKRKKNGKHSIEVIQISSSASSESASDCEEISSTLIIEKMKQLQKKKKAHKNY